MEVIDATLDQERANPVCVMTRVRLSNMRGLIKLLRAYRRTQRSLAGTPGITYAGLLFEGPLTIYMISIWETDTLMRRWVGVPSHVDAVHHSYQWATEIWSGRWYLGAISASAHRWSTAPGMENPRSFPCSTRRWKGTNDATPEPQRDQDGIRER